MSQTINAWAEKYAVGPAALEALDAVLSTSTPGARWREVGGQDPHGDRYDCERASLAMGHLSDDELANAVFLCGNEQPSFEQMLSKDYVLPAAYLTAAKDRIRWLSRKLVEAEQLAIAAEDANTQLLAEKDARGSSGYTSAMGEAAEKYHGSFKYAHPLPAQWRWEDVWAAMSRAAAPVEAVNYAKLYGMACEAADHAGFHFKLDECKGVLNLLPKDRTPVAAAPAVDALKRIKLRLHFLDMPGEPMWSPAGVAWVPDWRYEIQLIEHVLHGRPITAAEKPTDTRKRIEVASTPAAPGIDLDDVRALLRYGCAGEACTDEEIQNQRHYDAAAERLYSILIDGKIDASPKGGSDAQVVPYQRALDLIGDAYNAGTHGIGYSQQAMELHDAMQDSPKGGSFDVGHFVRDCCEADRDDPDQPDTICISVDALTLIAQRHMGQDSPKGGSDALEVAGWQMKRREDRTFGECSFAEFQEARKMPGSFDCRIVYAMQAASAEVGA